MMDSGSRWTHSGNGSCSRSCGRVGRHRGRCGMAKEDLSGRRVFVTGATGIVGSWLTRRLVDDGAYVVALVRDADPQSEFFRSGTSRRVSIVSGQLEDYTSIERAINEHETDVVMHLGAQT